MVLQTFASLFLSVFAMNSWNSQQLGRVQSAPDLWHCQDKEKTAYPMLGKVILSRVVFLVFFRNWGSMLLYMPFEVERRVCCHVDFFLFHVQYHSTPFRIRRLRASPLTHVMHACARVIYIYIEYAHIINIHMYWNPLGYLPFSLYDGTHGKCQWTLVLSQ
jgi:hypothetical protein